jgi:hypothetical protein
MPVVCRNDQHGLSIVAIEVRCMKYTGRDITHRGTLRPILSCISLRRPASEDTNRCNITNHGLIVRLPIMRS